MPKRVSHPAILPEYLRFPKPLNRPRTRPNPLAEVAAGKPSVISCGGGIILDPSNRKTMARTGTRVYLQVALPILIARLTPSADRPLLPKNQRSVLLARQLSERETWYAESEIKIEAGSGTPEETACRILDQLPPS
ncbi:MAG: hypothetical protein NTZ01_04205 [Verrucomicrobia bacterium]|nr:hypothetical protein [Verrucomicrobiota bacterium]